MVEALLGVAHVDGGFHQGQKSASLLIRPLKETILANFAKESTGYEFFWKEQSSLITQPKQALYEFLSHLQVKTLVSADFYKENERRDIPIWFGDGTTGYIGEVTWYDMIICCVADKHPSVATNRSCALFTSVVGRCADLMDKLKEMSDKLEGIGCKSSEYIE